MLWTLIPAKSFYRSKQRLGAVLDETQRARLSAAMLTHTVRVARQAFRHQPIMIVTPPDHEVAEIGRAAGADRIFSSDGPGLNAQLSEAAANVPGGDDLLVVHADLPLLRADDLRALNATSAPVALAPDAAGSGTNALLQRTAMREFAFGPRSYERHLAQATARGAKLDVVRRVGLACDLDEPADLQRLGLTLDDLVDRLLGNADAALVECPPA